MKSNKISSQQVATFHSKFHKDDNISFFVVASNLTKTHVKKYLYMYYKLYIVYNLTKEQVKNVDTKVNNGNSTVKFSCGRIAPQDFLALRTSKA